jgi:SNF2 family DNA or RNA helicase
MAVPSDSSAAVTAPTEPTLKPLWDGFAYKPHQISGVQWLLSRENSLPRGGILADEMGLGKTMEILGLVVNNPGLRNTLLLCPKAVIPQWVEAAGRSGINISVPQDGTDGGWQRPIPFRSGAPTIFITNYEKTVRRPKLFERSWNRIVCDEAHRISNRGGTMWQAVSKMRRESIWLVTATPIVNDLKDIRNLFTLVGYDKSKLTNFRYLSETVADACLHRSMEEMRPVLEELPDAPHIAKQLLDFDTEDEAEFYRGIQGQIVRRFKALEHDRAGQKEMFRLLMRLRQLSLHPQVYISARKKEAPGYTRKNWEGTSTKFAALQRKLESERTPARWIVFCQFHEEMNMLEAALAESGAVRNIWQYSGATSDEEKKLVLEATREPLHDRKHDVLLLQLHSGGVGLNLQHFSKVIFMSPWWTAALMDQAVGRAVRIGQTEVVEVTLLVLKEEASLNIDDKMLRKAESKRDVLRNILQYASRGSLGDEPTEGTSPLEGEEGESDADTSDTDAVRSSASDTPLAAGAAAGGGGSGEDPN